MDLAMTLAEGVQALREGDPGRAVPLLRTVVDDPDLSTDPDFRDIHARACSLLAQALLESGEPGSARRPLQQALEHLEALGDTEGQAAVKALQQRVGEAISEHFQAAARRRELRALADRPVEDVLQGVSDPIRRAALLVRKATAALEVQRLADAATLAEAARDQAASVGDVRHQVLAGLALARARPAEAARHLEAARAVADAADEANLVGAVAQAAAELGIDLTPPPAP